MKIWIQRMISVCILLMMITSLASASILGVSDDVMSFFDLTEEVRFAMGITMQEWVPFGDDELAMVNDVLGQIAINGEMSEDETVFQITIADIPLATFSQTDGTLETTLLPNRLLVSDTQTDLFSLLLPEEETDYTASFDPMLAISEVEACYEALTDAILPYAEEKTANYNIDNIDRSRWSRIARLTVEQSTELAPLIAAVLGCGMDDTYRAFLSELTYKKDFVVALYQTEEGGDDLAVYMKGTVVYPDDSQATLSYQWAFIDDGTDRRDTYKYEMSKSSPTDKRTVYFDFQQTGSSDVVSISGKSELTTKVSGETVVTTIQSKLEGAVDGSTTTLTGTQTETVKTTISSDTVSVVSEIAPNLQLLTGSDPAKLVGDILLTYTYDGTTISMMNVTFDENVSSSSIDVQQAMAEVEGTEVSEPEMSSDSSLSQNWDILQTQVKSDSLSSFEVGVPPLEYTKYLIPSEKTTLSMDGITEDQRNALMNEMSQHLAGQLLSMLAQMPDEVITLMSSGMLEEDFASFFSSLE